MNHLRPKFAFAIAFLVIVVIFQNCSFFGISYQTQTEENIEKSSNQPPVEPGIPEKRVELSSARSIPNFANVDDLQLYRERVWAGKCGPNNEWEVCFDGQNIPGFDQPSPFDWDNPRDDDWNRADSRRLSWRTGLNDLYSSSFMRVDRTIAGFTGFSGHFWRRDEFLLAANGFEAAFRIRILPQSLRFGVMLHFRDDVNQFKIHFGPNHISFHPFIGFASQATAEMARNNLSMTAFVVRKEANSGRVRVWADGIELFANVNLSPGVVGELWQPVTGYLGRIAPQIGFGDNNNDFDDEKAGAYDVDYFYYRRSHVPAGRPGLRAPHPLPSLDCQDWRVVRSDATGAAVSSTANLGSLIDDVAPNRFERSFDFSIRLLPNGKQDKGFSFDYFDRLGGINMTIYPDRIEAKGGGKPGLPTRVKIPGFNGLEVNRIRLARASDGLYWHIFVNENPIPVLVDIRSSGFSTPVRELLFGPFITKSIVDLAESENVDSRQQTGATAELPLIRWCP